MPVARRLFLLAVLAALAPTGPAKNSATSFEFTKHPHAPATPVLEGHSVKLECETSFHSHILWTVNDEPVTNASRRYYTSSSSSSSTLTITRTSRTKDIGKIRCTATSSSSGQKIKSDETTLDVTWLDYPTVELEQPEDLKNIVNGVDIHLICEADIGNGDVQYHWFRNSERVSSKMERFEVKKKKLHIKNINAKDNGVYRCNIHFNGETKDSKSNFILNIKDESIPHILAPPSDLLLPAKSFAMFNCQYKNADIVEWFKNDINVPLESNEKLTIHKNGSISIRNIVKKDEGFYSCVAFKTNDKSPLQKFSAKLKIAYIKPLTTMDFEPTLPEHRVIIAQEGLPFSIICLGSKDNNPPSQIMWKNKHLISDSGEIRVDDSALIIDIVKKNHQGLYTCTSENIAGTQELNIYIVINPTPNFVKNPTKLTVDENKGATFKCEITVEKQNNLYNDLKGFWNKIITLSFLKMYNGNIRNNRKHNENSDNGIEVSEKNGEDGFNISKDQIMDKWLNEFNWDLYELKWIKEGKVMKETQDQIKVLPREGILKFEKTSVSDKGTYWCEAITSAGYSVKSQSAQLIIIEKLKFSPPPVNRKLELGMSAKIHCKVQGTPTPNVLWFRDYNDTLSNDIQSINGTLQFSKVTRGHKGNYTCVAKNSQGTIETFIFIDVVVSPRFITPLPSQVIDVNEGDPVWIDCIAEGDPEPKTQWDRNLNIITTVNTNNQSDEESLGGRISHGDGLDENRRIYLLDNGTLYIKSVKMEDADQYGCTAGNSAGLRREEITLIVHNNIVISDETDEESVITKAILITMSVVGAYIILVIGLMVWCRVRRKRKLSRNLVNEKIENGELELKEEKDGPNDKLIENNDDIINTDEDKHCQIKNAKNKYNNSGNLKPKNGIIKSNEGCGNTTGGESGHNMSDNSEISANSKVSRKGYNGNNSRYDKIVLSRSLLYDIVPLGRGEFGDVMLAKICNSKSNRNSKIEEIELFNDNIINNDNSAANKLKPTKYVMIKSLMHTKDENHLIEFKRELDMYSKIKHDNVTEIIGLCNDMEPHYLVFEYTDWGDLKQFILATRTEDEMQKDKSIKIDGNSKANKTGNTTPLLVPQILALAHQITKGMEYISDSRMIHKDLATRNCLISSNFVVKISIPAMTKDIYSKEYYKHVNQVIPLRWLPYECVYESDYTNKSDVYMFASTVWEIFFKGELPFNKMSDATVLSHLKNNTLVWKHHEDMPQNLSELLDECWAVSLTSRPNFTDITKRISKILKDCSVSST